jgi:small subunit ribosomal protein S8
MVITDSIGDLIIRLKNANKVGKESIILPASNLKEAVATALMRAGFVGAVSRKGKDARQLEILLAYKSDKSPKINEVERISKSSRRIYKPSKEIKSFKNGFGAIILSTSKGILSNKEALKEKIGGEVMFRIW